MKQVTIPKIQYHIGHRELICRAIEELSSDKIKAKSIASDVIQVSKGNKNKKEGLKLSQMSPYEAHHRILIDIVVIEYNNKHLANMSNVQELLLHKMSIEDLLIFIEKEIISKQFKNSFS